MITKFKLYTENNNEYNFKIFDFIIQPYTLNIYIVVDINKNPKLITCVEIGHVHININGDNYFWFNHQPKTVHIQTASNPYLYKFNSRYLSKFFESDVFKYLKEKYDYSEDILKKQFKIQQFKI